MSRSEGLSYAATGVDLEAAESAKEGLKHLLAATRDRNTLSELGLFGGLYAVPQEARHPVLVSSADGVGTKLKVAFLAGRHDTVGRDLVNHCVNDILVQGARPLFFLDYLGTGEMKPKVVGEVVRGVAQACQDNGCVLLGGETAQMPEFYGAGEYDLVGFIVGLVERDAILDGSRVRPGDILVALASSGLHTNGYTLARRIVFERMGLRVDDAFPEMEGSVADVLLEPHRSYLHSVAPLLQSGRVHGLAHITGGGIPGNLPRSLPPGCGALIDQGSWEVPEPFPTLQRAGGVDRQEMFRVFNMGVGMIAVVPPEEVEDTLRELGARGERAWVLGQVTGERGVRIAS